MSRSYLRVLFGAATLALSVAGGTSARADAPFAPETWQESEGGWTGTWVRRSAANRLEGTWTNPAFTAETGTLDVMKDGAALTIHRKSTRGTCRYTGTLQGDGVTVTGTVTCSHGPAPVPFRLVLPAGYAALPPTPAVPGRVWAERELTWNGAWTRRAGTNVFDATWTNTRGAGTAQGTLTMTAEVENGTRRLTIARVSPGQTCTYTTTKFSPTALAGKYRCSNLSGELDWSASVDAEYRPPVIRCADVHLALDVGDWVECHCPTGAAVVGVSAVAGTDVYRDTSPICPAALHAGVIGSAQENRVVRVTGVAGVIPNPGSARHGITSSAGEGPPGSRYYRVTIASAPLSGLRSDD